MRAHQIIFYMLNVTRLFIQHYYSRGLLFIVRYSMVNFYSYPNIKYVNASISNCYTVGLLCAPFSVKFLTVSK